VLLEGDRTVTLWSPGKSTKLPGHVSPVTGLAVSPDGRLLATSAGGEVKLWDVAGAREVSKLPRLPSVGALAFAPDGKTLATATGSDVRLWEVATGALRRELGHADRVVALAFAPDGRALAAAGADGEVAVHDLRTGRQRCTLTGPKGPISSLAFSADGAVVAGARGAALVWRLPSSKD